MILPCYDARSRLCSVKKTAWESAASIALISTLLQHRSFWSTNSFYHFYLCHFPGFFIPRYHVWLKQFCGLVLEGTDWPKFLNKTETTFVSHVSLTGILKQFLYKIRPLDGALISVFSKMSGPTLVLSDWIGDKAAGDESFLSHFSLVLTHTLRVRRYICMLPFPRLHSVQKEDITIYKIYAKVKAHICCMTINE
jgi:hypothetical protein